MSVLHLTLKKHWFQLIRDGIKTTEYREVKPYWERRLKGKKFKEVHFRNGYRKASPFMRVEYIRTDIVSPEESDLWVPSFAIRLGKILEVRE